MNNYLNFSNDEIKLTVWEIKNKNKNEFVLKNQSFNFLELKKYKTILGKIISVASNYTQSQESDNNENVFFKTDNIHFGCDEQPWENINNFYLYSFSDNFNNDTDFYFLSNNSQQFELNELSDTNLYDLNLENIKNIKNYNSNYISYELFNENNELINIDEIILNLDNSVLLNNISFIGNLQNENSNKIIKNINIPIELKDNIQLIPNFVNPIAVNDEEIKLYFSSLNNLYTLDTKSIFNYFNINDNSVNISGYLNNNDAFNLIKEVIENTKVLTTSFMGMNEFQINKFKKKYSGSNPKELNDFLIKQKITYYSSIGDFQVIKKLQAILICLSDYIISSYCWKGGFSDEHKLGLIFYLNYVNNKFYLKSEYLSLINKNNLLTIKSNNNHLLKNNIFSLNEKVVQLPNLPNIIENQQISNTPVDFNDKSYNLNYICWTPVLKNYDINSFYFLKYQSNFFVKKYQAVIKPFDKTKFTDWSPLLDNQKWYEKYKNNYIEIENKLRELTSIPSTIFPTDPARFGIENIIYGAYLDSNNDNGISNLPKISYIAGFTIYGYFTVPENLNIEVNDTQFVFSNILDWEFFLNTKNAFQNLDMSFCLENKFKKQGWKINKITKIIISSLLTQNINIIMKDNSENKIKNYQINLLAKKGIKNTKTIIEF